MMSANKRVLLPIGAGLLGAVFLAGIYFGIVSWAESANHALELFWQDRWIVVPIIIGFGIQVALYTILKFKLYVPQSALQPNDAAASSKASGASVGAGGATSTLAMVACCAHHVTDVLPILGLTAAATFLAKYQVAFMVVGLGTTITGIVVMLIMLAKERRRLLHSSIISPQGEGRSEDLSLPVSQPKSYSSIKEK